MAGQVINGGDLMLFIDDKSIAFATKPQTKYKCRNSRNHF